MLHLISRFDNSIPIYFLNTGFLFPETIQFKDEISKRWDLKVISVRSSQSRIQQKNEQGRFLYTSDPDYCCYLNKVQPMEPLLASHDVWINGVRADQTAVRKNMAEEQPYSETGIRYHPMLRWTKAMIESYIQEHSIPRHPLDRQGYESIGCEPCTRKIDLDILGDERLSRWFGLNKTECGLHTDLIKPIQKSRKE